MEKKVIDLSKERCPVTLIMSREDSFCMKNTKDPFLLEDEKDIAIKNDVVVFEYTPKGTSDPFDLVPKSWEEYCKRHSYEFSDDDAYDKIVGVCPLQDIDEFIAMFKLRRLWYEWIKVLGEAVEIVEAIGYNHKKQKFEVITFSDDYRSPLCFADESHAEKFIECFPELLDKAKILL